MSYTHDADTASDPEALERAQELKARFGPMAKGSPQWRYLVDTRGLPAEAVRRCSGDLAALEPPIPYFGASDYGVVSIIRDAKGGDIGFAVEACGVAGEAIKRDGRTLRRFFRLAGVPLSRGLFGAVTGGSTDTAVLVEGHLAKAIAAAAIFPDHNVYGFGSRSWLGKALPPEAKVLVLEDSTPTDGEDDDDGE